MTIVAIWLQPHPSTCVLHAVNSFTVFLHSTNGRHMPAISAALLLSVVFEELWFPQITRAYNALHPTHNSVQGRSHHLYFNQPTIQLTTPAISHTGSPPTTRLRLCNSLSLLRGSVWAMMHSLPVLMWAPVRTLVKQGTSLLRAEETSVCQAALIYQDLCMLTQESEYIHLGFG